MLKESVYTTVGLTLGTASLNPYFNGTCSKSKEFNSIPNKICCLNPYFNGTCSKRGQKLQHRPFA